MKVAWAVAWCEMACSARAPEDETEPAVTLLNMNQAVVVSSGAHSCGILRLQCTTRDVHNACVWRLTSLHGGARMAPGGGGAQLARRRPAKPPVHYWQACVHIDGGWAGCKPRHTSPVDCCNVRSGVHLHVACGAGLGGGRGPVHPTPVILMCVSCSLVPDLSIATYHSISS